MIRIIALFASSSILASCGTLSAPTEDLPQSAPQACKPSLRADLEPEPPVKGSIVAPVTDQEIDATRDHLTSDADARAWGRRGWARAATAREECLGR